MTFHLIFSVLIMESIYSMLLMGMLFSFVFISAIQLCLMPPSAHQSNLGVMYCLNSSLVSFSVLFVVLVTSCSILFGFSVI